jgi:hypothetical protein
VLLRFFSFLLEISMKNAINPRIYCVISYLIDSKLGMPCTPFVRL